MRYSIILLTLGLLLLEACERPTERMQGYEVHGVDVSHYQSYINWDTVAIQGIHFAFVKATEGETLADTLFPHNWEELKRLDFYRGAYHFFRPTVAPERQMDNYACWVKLDYGDLPPVVDVEVMDGVSKIDLIKNLTTWLFLAEIKFNTKPIIYTNVKFYNDYLAGHFENYPLWIARYNDSDMPVLKDDKPWHFWQYGNRGQLRGIDGDVDLNVFYGNQYQLEEMTIAPQTVLSNY